MPPVAPVAVAGGGLAGMEAALACCETRLSAAEA